jgi:hypothetical protein
VATRLYRDHFIMAFPSFDTATRRWVPQADISCARGACRRFKFLVFPRRCATEEEAAARALDLAQAWIDRHPRELSSDDRSPREQAIDLLEAWNQSVLRQRRAPRDAPAARAKEKVLAFPEFRSRLTDTGLTVGLLTLQRSYAALDRLRRRRHLSWAETRRKLERLGESLQAGSERLRAARLPLTEQAWSRI